MSRYFLGDGIFENRIELEIPESPPPCMRCGRPVLRPSMAGPLFCGPCDMGKHPDGSPITAEEEAQMTAHASEYVERYRISR